jgi:NAD(P)-dependent dehydrogenase (short-subunit alcohol dehydrogenase family)
VNEVKGDRESLQAPNFQETNHMNLAGQKIIIFGGTSGIGHATAKLAADNGANVIITGRDQSRLERAIAEVGKGVIGESVDATERQVLHDFFARVGKFDHLVLSISSGGGAGAFAALDIPALQKPIEGKVIAQLQAAQAALSTLAPAGSITFVSAASARAAFAGTVGLAAINGALNAAAATLALELKPRRVNVVSPGIVDTPIWSHFPETERKNLLEREAKALPVGRIGQPEEVAQAIVMLMSNGFITGTVIDCDGGARVK